eukprot:COSAG06_NODE_3994_length_4678_cov_23.025551_3_plen_325_part_00
MQRCCFGSAGWRTLRWAAAVGERGALKQHSHIRASSLMMVESQQVESIGAESQGQFQIFGNSGAWLPPIRSTWPHLLRNVSGRPVEHVATRHSLHAHNRSGHGGVLLCGGRFGWRSARRSRRPSARREGVTACCEREDVGPGSSVAVLAARDQRGAAGHTRSSTAGAGSMGCSCWGAKQPDENDSDDEGEDEDGTRRVGHRKFSTRVERDEETTTARQKQKDEEEVDEERDDNDGANVQKVGRLKAFRTVEGGRREEKTAKQKKQDKKEKRKKQQQKKQKKQKKKSGSSGEPLAFANPLMSMSFDNEGESEEEEEAEERDPDAE